MVAGNSENAKRPPRLSVVERRAAHSPLATTEFAARQGLLDRVDDWNLFLRSREEDERESIRAHESTGGRLVRRLRGRSKSVWAAPSPAETLPYA